MRFSIKKPFNNDVINNFVGLCPARTIESKNFKQVLAIGGEGSLEPIDAV